MDAKSCIIEKTFHFTHFNQKNTHISGYKIVYLCTSATVTVHICTVTVALTFFFSLLHLTLTSLSFISGPLIRPHRHDQFSLIDIDQSSVVDQPHKSVQRRQSASLISLADQPRQSTSMISLADQSSLTDTISLTFDPF